VRQQADTATVASNVYINSHLEQGQLPFVPSVLGSRTTAISLRFANDHGAERVTQNVSAEHQSVRSRHERGTARMRPRGRLGDTERFSGVTTSRPLRLGRHNDAWRERQFGNVAARFLKK
jgi:hypothetical protein